MGDLLITVAPTGAETTKDDCPQLPTTLDRAGRDGPAVRGRRRRDGPRPHPRRRAPTDARRPRLTDTVAALREGTDLVVQLSTGGSVHDPLETGCRSSTPSPTPAA